MSKKTQIVNPASSQVRKTAEFSVTQAYCGPLPCANEMRQYAEVFDELPERIVAMAEAEQQHRFERLKNSQDQQKNEFRANFFLTCFGMLASVFCVLIIMTASVICAWLQHPITAGVIGSGGVGLIVAVFICGSKIKTSLQPPEHNK